MEENGMDWLCCDRCAKYFTCVIKWYRGERGEPNLCCQECQNYPECLASWKKIKELNEKHSRQE